MTKKQQCKQFFPAISAYDEKKYIGECYYCLYDEDTICPAELVFRQFYRNQWYSNSSEKENQK